MTVNIHPKTFDENQVVISTDELKHLIKAVGENNRVEVELIDDINGENLMKLCETGGSFNFLLDEGEDIYTLEDLKVRH